MGGLYPGYNSTIQHEIEVALIEAVLTCTAPNATSIVGYAIDLPNTHITFHTLMKILSGSFCIVVILIALFLTVGHVTHWAAPAEQRQIVRVIAFLPVYGIGAFISIYLYRTQPYVAPVPDWYEGFSIVAIFLLFVTLVAPDESTRDQVLDDIAAQRGTTSSRGGSKAYRRCCLFVFQIIPSRIATLIATETLYAVACPLSKKLRYGALIIQLVQGISTNMAVIAVIRFESRYNSLMKRHQPRIKLWVFKSIVFLEFAQNVVFSALASAEAYRPTQYVSYYDMSIGLNQFIISCECFIYALLYIKAFEYGSYRETLKVGHHIRSSPLSAILDIINPMDIIKGTLVAFGLSGKPNQPRSYGGNHITQTNGTSDPSVDGMKSVGDKRGSESSI